MALLMTEWSSDDPSLSKLLRNIAELPEWSEERLAAEAALHTWQAQHCHRRIGEMRGWQRERAVTSKRNSHPRTIEAP